MQNYTQTFLSIVAAGLVSVSAAAQDSPVFAWGKTFDGATTAGDQSTAIAAGTDGSVYWYNTLGTSGSALDLTFGGQYLFTGAPYSGTSNNSNFSLTKTDADGNLLWAIGSDSGDFANQQGNIAVCPDGSVVFTAKVRHTDGMLQSPISFVDANGRKVAVGQGVEGSRYYFLLIGKVSSDGEILWVRTAEPSRSVIVGDAETALSDIVTVSGTVIDENGHIYIGGSFGHTLTFSSGADTASLTATNTQNWDGKANVCDLFVACFDADGNYIKGMNNTGNPAGNMKVLSMEAEGSMIYFHGVATPVEGCADRGEFGGHVIYEGQTASPFVGAIDVTDPNDMQVEWITSITATPVDNRGAYQNGSISVGGGDIWICGLGNGVFAADGCEAVSTATGNIREGLLFKIDKLTGACLGGTSSRTGYPGMTQLTGYVSSFQAADQPGKVYVYGYAMNANVGAFVHVYDAGTLAACPDEGWTLVTQGGTPTATAFAYDAENAAAYLTVRGNKAFQPEGGEASEAPQGWAIYASRFDLPDVFLSGVADIAADSSGIGVLAGQGFITLSSASAVTVGIYDLAGRMVARTEVDGTATVNLPAGIYIAAGQKAIVR